MRNKIRSKLWIYLASMIFLLILTTFITFTIIIYFIARFDLLPGKDRFFPFFIFIASVSIVISSGVSAIVGRRILKPIEELRKSMKQVTQGDFSIQMNQVYTIDEVRDLYEDFNHMVKELGSTETLRNDFVSSVSHEFKTPITIIQGYVQLLQDSELTAAERAEFYQRILEGTQQLATLSDNILKLTKLETQNSEIDKHSFRLDEQIREVILFLQPKWERRNLELDIELPSAKYNGNEEFLYQVWLNIMDNAIKYNRENGKISVKLEDKGESFLIEVVDTGLGMTDQEAEKAFDKFYQADTSRKTEGNGLGLSLSQKIIELHAGRIQVNSELEIGTVFVIELPK
ncbi:two-component sensor histidine kinase [Enterococcus sp. JM4C]|uniref:sensor histidine kinase n=1 Tax=Candidatus Enterococcus huntleyi TaxID=1857217 RepID=UPI00137AF457|nr:HAMP domain-containing sensor histidine kinase [Enterococcus sp. JM4C]KAF1297382.1 two-component sensor histidine kinase [Enterococcus sp. JM4C]